MLTNDVIIEKNINNHRYLQFKKLVELGIKNVITTNDLNFNFRRISKEEITNNLNIVCNDFNLNINHFCRPYQNHTSNVKIVSEYGFNIEPYDQTDALITDQKDVPIAITTADCIPIIIYDQKKKVIANVHSGWKGTVQGILQNTITKLIDNYNCNINDMLFFFGPALCKKCFEVEEDVKILFENKYPDCIIEKGQIINGKQKYYIDNSQTLINYLIKKGVKKDNIYNANICTCCHKDILHSYRGKTDSVLKLNITIVSL